MKEAGGPVPRVEMLKVSELQEPPYTALIQQGPRISRILSEIKDGTCSRLVAVGCKDGMYYPVGGLDVLEAHRRNSSDKVPCIITDTEDLLGAHLSHARAEIVNPARMLEYAAGALVSGGSLRAFPAAYAKMAGLRITKGALDRLSSYVEEMAKKHGEVPSTYHILPALARLEGTEQEAALDTVVRYAGPGGGFPPDRMALKKIIRMHAGRGGARDDSEPRAGPPDPGDEGGRVPGVARHDCPCGKRYVMEKNGTVRELREAEGGAIILDGDHGEPVYGMPRHVSSHLGLDMQPKMYYHDMEGAVIMTRVRHPAKAIRYAGMLLDPARRGPLVEYLGSLDLQEAACGTVG
ncbi:hypothetical protein CENSYa_0755 [Cenarchaeum symbiosum A]|uniref:Uncharacterized protein n=1 Tax=Cenarchaeum symbiosum (strain A) TaxID=414004 RepID=A0RVM1_CENSY|nr:hypothetical protein CENSYa_0755 [Cenarchaeum symbiosum A]